MTDFYTKAGADTAISTAVAGATIVDATTSVKGKVQLATNTEATTGTDTAKAITASGLAAAIAAAPAVPDATSSTKGKVQLATTGEATTGTDTAKAVTAAGVAAAITGASKVSQPPSGVTVVMQFVYTDPTVARPSIPSYASLNWIGPAGSGGAAPTNMATNDTWDMQ